MGEGRSAARMRLFSDVAEGVLDPYLRRAVELAERGRGTTSPNPVVGCVIVRDGVIVGEGWHRAVGGPHAEVHALRAAKDASRGADAYVTLEPCNHHGRTPPCVDALVQAGVSTVVIGMADPNPRVAGGGSAALKAHGVEVRYAPDPDPFVEQNREWVHACREGRPFVRVKIALTLDGHPAIEHGKRSRLTGPAAAVLTARLRASSDAVAVGVSTLAVDDPRMTVRDPEGEPTARQPLRVVLGRSSVPDPGAAIFAGPGRSVALLGDCAPQDAVAALAAGGVATLAFEVSQGLRGAIAVLGREGVVSLLVEPGPRLFDALMREGLVDELVLYHAGGMAGPGAPWLCDAWPAGGAGFGAAFTAVESGVVGGDAVTVWRPTATGTPS